MKDPIKLNNISDYLAHIWGPPNADLSTLSIGELRERFNVLGLLMMLAGETSTVMKYDQYLLKECHDRRVYADIEIFELPNGNTMAVFCCKGEPHPTRELI